MNSHEINCVIQHEVKICKTARRNDMHMIVDCPILSIKIYPFTDAVNIRSRELTDLNASLLNYSSFDC